MRFRILILLTLGLVAAAAGYGFLVWKLHQPIGTAGKTEFTILPGESVSQIGAKLDQVGLMDAAIFVLYVRSKNLTSKIQAGRYEIPLVLTPVQVVELFQHGTFDVRLTFLEGWRREQFLEYALENLAVDDGVFSPEFLAATENLEGRLFPDTYVVPIDIGAAELVEILRANFDQKYQESITPAEVASGLTQGQILIIASLLERETLERETKEEMEMIAGILVKRWQSGWRLDVDATIQYILGRDWNAEKGRWEWWKDSITAADKKIDSPYNTYKYTGLPPGPIANPGLDTLLATVNYRESPYWFYLHCQDGQVKYAATLEEHNANKACLK